VAILMHAENAKSAEENNNTLRSPRPLREPQIIIYFSLIPEN